jgi:hypothetical protein
MHRAGPDAEQNAAPMKRMGITEEQDEEWRRTHLTVAEQRPRGLKQIEPAAPGTGFVTWCVKQGWLVQQGKKHLATKDSRRELAV